MGRRPARRRLVVVAASGSSDPDANGDVAKAARFLAEQTGHRWAEHAFAGVTWPRTDVVLSRLARAGAPRVVLFSWSLLAGLLEQSVAAAAADVSKRTGLQVADAGRFGPHPLVADAVVDRYHEAVDGDARMNCDLCASRVPLPGLERRVAAPSVGTATRLRRTQHRVDRPDRGAGRVATDVGGDALRQQREGHVLGVRGVGRDDAVGQLPQRMTGWKRLRVGDVERRPRSCRRAAR